MNLSLLLKKEAGQRQLLAPEAPVDAATAFYLVRDMPYQRASDRQPETIIREWRGTCSGKHYLLKALLAECGFEATVIACTVSVPFSPADLPPPLWQALAPTHGRFVDVHNYLHLHLPQGDMVVDATWPLATKPLGLTVNERFELGRDQAIAYAPIQTWAVPETADPQTFKERLLAEHFTPQELAAREAFIQTLSQMLAQNLPG